MTKHIEYGGGWQSQGVRIAVWSVAGLAWVVPLVAMQFTEEVDWDGADFAIAGVLIFGTGIAYELAAWASGSTAYRVAVGVGLAAAFLLTWGNLAVGLIGSEDNPANRMCWGVLGVGFVGAVISRLRSRGMAYGMFATALAQVLVAAIALIAGWGPSGTIWEPDVIGLTAFFTALWITSAFLFQRASRDSARFV